MAGSSLVHHSVQQHQIKQFRHLTKILPSQPAFRACMSSYLGYTASRWPRRRCSDNMAVTFPLPRTDTVSGTLIWLQIADSTNPHEPRHKWPDEVKNHCKLIKPITYWNHTTSRRKRILTVRMIIERELILTFFKLWPLLREGLKREQYVQLSSPWLVHDWWMAHAKAWTKFKL